MTTQKSRMILYNHPAFLHSRYIISGPSTLQENTALEVVKI